MLYIFEAFYASENSLLFNIFIRLFHCKKYTVMLSDVIVDIFNSHMTVWLNIIKAQGAYILLRLFPFSQNIQHIVSTRLYFHEPKDKCPCLNYSLPK